MREARYVSLIPRTTLHSDSEQVEPDILLRNECWYSRRRYIPPKKCVKVQQKGETLLRSESVIIRNHANRTKNKRTVIIAP